MNNIYKYVEGLLPNFEKATVHDDLKSLTEELKNMTLPPYIGACDVFTTKSPFKTKTINNYNKTIMLEAKGNRSANSIIYITDILKKIQEAIPELTKIVDDLFGRDIARDGLTYPKANCLRLIEAISFVLRYSRRYLLFVYSQEEPAYHDGRNTLPNPFTKAELADIENNLISFAKLLPVFDRNSREMRTLFHAIPDMHVNEEQAGVAVAVAGATKLDPFKTGLIPFRWNPIYHIRIALADWQVSRYKAAQEEKKALELRLLQMKLAQEGKKDAALEKQIDYTEERLQNLIRKLDKFEADYA